MPDGPGAVVHYNATSGLPSAAGSRASLTKEKRTHGTDTRPVTGPATRTANHLAGQTSPYLLQHVYNPVDWYPWGPEALEQARNRDVPIFLSIGYSACHWCHVMERECFEDRDIAGS